MTLKVSLWNFTVCSTFSIDSGVIATKIAEEQKETIFTMTDRNDKDLFALAELYSDDNIEHVIEPNAFEQLD
jgi:hypothetical protein